MTGFFAIVRGCSLRTASHDRAAGRSSGSQIDFALRVDAMSHQNTCPCAISRCSTIGPRLSAGKNVSAPTIRITPTSSAAKSGVVTGNVPGDGGTRFLRAEAAGDRQHRDDHEEAADEHRRTPIVTLYQCVLAFSPANAEPLLPAPDVKA